MKELIVNSILKRYLSSKDIEELVYNQKLSDYFNTAMDIDLSKFHKLNPENERKLFAKVLFDWIKNYDPKLEKDPKEFSKIVFKVYYEEDIESCSDERKKPYSKIDGRNDINKLKNI